MSATDLLTAVDVAERLGGNITERTVLRWTRERGWPHVAISRKVIRYRIEHVEQIVALYDREAETNLLGIPGQTRRSRRSA